MPLNAWVDGEQKTTRWWIRSANTIYSNPEEMIIAPIHLQSGHDIDYIDKRSHGRFRIFSKLGLGTGGEFLNVGYACLPVLDPNEQPVPGWGRELVIAARFATGGSDWSDRDRNLARAYRKILVRVVDGRL